MNVIHTKGVHIYIYLLHVIKIRTPRLFQEKLSSIIKIFKK